MKITVGVTDNAWASHLHARPGALGPFDRPREDQRRGLYERQERGEGICLPRSEEHFPPREALLGHMSERFRPADVAQAALT